MAPSTHAPPPRRSADIKAWLLPEAVRDGSLREFLTPPEVVALERHGEAFFPIELSALVHIEAVQVADGLRTEAVARGLPIVVAESVAREVDAVERYRVFTRSIVGVPAVLTVDEKRSSPEAPLNNADAGPSRTSAGHEADGPDTGR